MVRLGDETVTVRRAPRISDHGSSVADWSGTLTSTSVAGCSVQPGASTEDLAHREGQQVDFTVFMPTGSDVTGDDRLGIRGRDYPVIGDPEDWRDRTLAHMKVLVASWRDLA